MEAVQIRQGSGKLGVRQEAAESSAIRLQDLIPIAMVIVGGCESCAEKMVERALNEGSSSQDIDKTLRIIAGMQKLGCFAGAVGPEVVSRMDKPLEAGRRTLEKAIHPSAAGSQPGPSLARTVVTSAEQDASDRLIRRVDDDWRKS